LLSICVPFAINESNTHAETIEKTVISPAVTSIALDTESEIVDTATLPDGGVVYLSEKWAVWPPTSSNPEPQRINLAIEQRFYFRRLFVDPADEKAFFVAASLSSRGDSGMAMFRLTEASFQLIDFVREPVRYSSYHQASNGEIFVTSQTGVILRFDGKRLTRFALPWPDSESFSLSKKFERLEFISWPSGPTCCFSIANREKGNLALFDLLVAKPDGWQRIALDLPRTGPACFINDRTVRMLLPNRWIEIDLPTGKKTETKFEPPQSETENLEPMKLVRLPDGKFVSIWKRTAEQPGHKYKLEPLHGDAFHQIATWEEERWKIAPLGIDRQLDGPQFHEIDKMGGLWLLGGEGTLVHRSSEGKWSEFGYERGLPVRGIVQLTHDRHRELLRINYTDSNRITELSTAKISEQESTPKPTWRVFFGKRYEKMEQGGRLQPIRTRTGEIVVVGPTGVKVIDPPTKNVFEVGETPPKVRLDSRDSLWIHNADFTQVARRKDTDWQRYSSKPLEGGVDLTPLEAAAEKLADEGFKEGDYAPGIAFGPEKQMAVIGSKGVSFFDGKLWHLARNDGFTGGQFLSVEFRREKEIPKWVLKTKSREYALLIEKLVGQGEPTDPMLALGPATAFKRIVLTAADSARLNSTCPIEEAKRKWMYVRPEGLALAADKKQLAFYNGERWAQAPFVGCPFSAHLHKRWSSDFSGTYGRWVMASRVSDYTYCYAIYDPPGVTVATTKKDLGNVATPEAALTPTWIAEPKLNDANFRFRIDEGVWSKWRSEGEPIHPGGVMPPGDHQLQLEIQSPTQVVNHSKLTYHFAVTYDLTERLEQLVQRLGSLKFQERHDATEELLKLGPMIRNQLISMKSRQTDREIQLRLEHLIEVAQEPW